MSRLTAALGTLLLLATPVVLIAWLWGPQTSHAFVIGWMGGAYIWIPLAVIVLLIILAIAFGGSRGGGPFVALSVLGAIAMLAVAIPVWWVPHTYQQGQSYNADAKVTTAPLPDFSQRAAYDVAAASTKRLLGDTTGTALNVKSLVDEGRHGQWSALIQRQGVFAGYQAVQVQDVPLYGLPDAKNVTSCTFDFTAAGQRMGGVWPHESLDYRVLGATPANVTFDAGDAYAYCDGKTPKVVMPLKALNGWWTPTWVAYGAAVYDGKTGALAIHRDTADIPGPVYPQSLAIQQREALQARGSWDDYWYNRSGWKDTAGDDGDPNGGNRSEFGLRFLGQSESGYVTPLTPRGSSSSIVAVSVTDSSTAHLNRRNPITVYRYASGDSRQANSTVAQGIKSQSSSLPDWASGLTIYEIVPGRDGQWVASIGLEQGVVYRAVVNRNGDATLYDADGTAVAGKGAKKPTPKPGTHAAPPATSDLAKLTPEQLQELGQAILDELARRAAE